LSLQRHATPLQTPAAWPYCRYSKLAEDQLRNLRVRSLIIAGIRTDQCVESTVRDPCDLGYPVTVVTDAGTTSSVERHAQSPIGIRGYCRRHTVAELLAEITAVTTEH